MAKAVEKRFIVEVSKDQRKSPFPQLSEKKGGNH